MSNKLLKKHKLPPIAILAIGYLVIILTGTILLLMPFSKNPGETTKFVDAFFTATSATCVTGLIPYDTATHWSMAGQIIILCMIQIGGLGFMTFISLVVMIFKRNIGLYNQRLMMQSSATYTRSQIIPFIKRILVASLFFEIIGATLLTLCFRSEYGSKAIYYGIFHSISAYCNAGFDIFAFNGGSITGYYNNPFVLFILAFLIIFGGLGFLVYNDILVKKFRFKKFELHTKIVLVFTLVLIIVPMLLYLMLEFTNFPANGAFSNYSLGEKLLNAFFMSVTTRTAGFNAIDLTQLSSSGKLLTIVLMLIGGNTGSTAGGIKVTTFIIIIATLISSAKNKEDIELFKATVPTKVVKQSTALISAYLVLILLSVFLIGAIETNNFSFENILFEVTSAIGTVGLSVGVSATASAFTKFLLAFLMFSGRIGAFTLFDLLFKDKNSRVLRKPEGRVLVG